MIVSHRHKFIFVKTHKTAGTSVEIALSKFCGPKDIITPVSKVDEQTRTELGYRSPQNYRKPLLTYSTKEWKRLVLKKKRVNRFYNHMPATEIRRWVGEGVWSSYFKFCFERNPWDKTLSRYFWRYRRPDGNYPKRNRHRPKSSIDVPAFIRMKKFRHTSDYYMYTIDGEVAVDYIGRYENLEQDLNTVCERLGLPRAELPGAKSGVRTDKRHYRDVLNPDDAEIVARVFSREIDLLGYTF